MRRSPAPSMTPSSKPPDRDAVGASDAPEDTAAETGRLHTLRTTREVAARPTTRLPTPTVPFEALPAIPAETRRALEAAALESNDQYLETFLEPHSFCPFSRGGRQRGQTLRQVHYADTASVAPFLDLIREAAQDPSKLVVQVIVPMIEVSPAAWIRFCHQVTDVGNALLRAEAGAGPEVFAVAPLHPELPYTAHNAYTLIPLLRRTPDPTLQWVRLDALARLYAGRSGDTVCVDLEHIAAYLAQTRPRPMFERIAETNLGMARRLGITEVERILRGLARAAHDRYVQVLLRDTPPSPVSSGGCPHRSAPQSDRSPPRPALCEREGRWALVSIADLTPRVPTRFLAADVEVVAVRVGDTVHVLHGRCPHRNAPLSDAIVEADHLVCPHHGWDFQLASGLSDGVPGASVARFRTWTDDGLVWVDDAELRAWHLSDQSVFQPDDDVL